MLFFIKNFSITLLKYYLRPLYGTFTINALLMYRVIQLFSRAISQNRLKVISKNCEKI